MFRDIIDEDLDCHMQNLAMLSFSYSWLSKRELYRCIGAIEYVLYCIFDLLEAKIVDRMPQMEQISLTVSNSYIVRYFYRWYITTSLNSEHA